MKVKTQIAVARLVLAAVWLAFIGGCTVRISIAPDSYSGGFFNVLGLLIGSTCTAPAVRLVQQGAGHLLGRVAVIAAPGLAAAVALALAAVVLVHAVEFMRPGEWEGVMFTGAFALCPAVAFAVWAAVSWRASRDVLGPPG